MGFFKKIEETLWTGKIIKDYGVIDEKQMGIVKPKHRVMLTEKNGEKNIIIKESIVAGISAYVKYFRLDKPSAQNLKDAVEDALKSM